MQTTTRRVLALLALAIVSTTIAACNTMEGVGKDIKAGGEGIEDAAK